MNNITFDAESPDDIAMTLTVTMKMKEWKALRSDITPKDDLYAGSIFIGVIEDMIGKAEKHFYKFL